MFTAETTKPKLFAEGFYSVRQVKDKDDFLSVMKLADRMGEARRNREQLKVLEGFKVGLVFNQPSSRTYLSFKFAVETLGGTVIEIDERNSSQLKGEDWTDHLVTLACSGGIDILVLRDESPTAAQEAQQIFDEYREQIGRPVKVINAGNGTGEHPTQAYLDVYTMLQVLGDVGIDIAKLNIGFVGDLLNGRTTHSLGILLSMFFPDNTLSLVPADGLAMPDSYVQEMTANGLSVVQGRKLEEVIGEVDFLYMTRLQKEYLKKQGYSPEQQQKLYEEMLRKCGLTPELVKKMKRDAKILHPLPRNDEIPKSIDSLRTDDGVRRAYYFEQSANAGQVRMALLTLLKEVLQEPDVTT
jgi:carbamoyl-phosphate synthase/aspartate carbamoyltransferase